MTHRVSSVLMGALLLVLALPGGVAHSASSPCGNLGNWGKGVVAFNETTYGSKARISQQDPDLCGSASVSVAWVMVTGASSLDGWAQVGFGRFGSNDPYPQQPGGYSVFSQWIRSSSTSPRTTVTGNSPALNPVYKTEYVFSTGVITMWAGSTLVDATNNTWDPAIEWSAPWQPQFVGETIHKASDMPGIASKHVSFTGMKRLTNRVGDWDTMQDPSFAAFPNTPDRYHRQWVTKPTDMDIWTHPL